MHGGGGQLGGRFVIRSSAFETTAKARHGDGHETDKGGYDAKSALDGHAVDFSDGSGRVRRPVRDEGVLIAVSGPYASNMKT
jgi:hypothetical protein